MMRSSYKILVLGLLLPAALSGCARNKHTIEINNHFSINVVETPDWFPGDKEIQLTSAELDVLLRRGNPDYIRLWWRPDGSFITTSDLTNREEQIGRDLAKMDKSWIYVRDKEEVIFSGGRQSYKVVPLDEVLALVCKYGDPSSRSVPRYQDGRRYETWQWIEHGLQIEMINGQVGKITHFPATGQGTWGLK